MAVISLARGQSSKWINHKHKLPAQIYFDSNTHKKIENMKDSLRFYKDLCPNRVLEFPVNIFFD